MRKSGSGSHGDHVAGAQRTYTLRAILVLHRRGDGIRFMAEEGIDRLHIILHFKDQSGEEVVQCSVDFRQHVGYQPQL